VGLAQPTQVYEIFYALAAPDAQRLQAAEHPSLVAHIKARGLDSPIGYGNEGVSVNLVHLQDFIFAIAFA